MDRRFFWSGLSALMLSMSMSGIANAAAASPSVSGPVTGGNGVPVIFGHTTFDLGSVGYAQSEYFVEGNADSYAPTVPLTSDGKWLVAPATQAAYKTRVIVNRPVNGRDFNGSVVVEWLNVSGQVDASPDWIHMHNELIRRGFAWIGVSAQAIGLNANKNFDPVRYASVVHPGDSYSYDMFSQVGQAIRDNAATLLGGLRLKRLIAVGESQSAGRMVTYINAAHPLVKVYDGFLVHSRGSGGAALSQAPLPVVATPAPSLIRDDLNVPVLVFQAENDVGGLLARQPDSSKYRLWEVAGTAHFDLYGLVQGATDTGGRETVTAWFDSMLNPPAQPSPTAACDRPINTGAQTFVLRAAISHLDRWIARRTPPPRASRLETVSVQPVQYVLDTNGNVRGGVRTPAVDAPVATLSGLGNTGAQFCILFGTTVPLTQEQLTALYRTHGRFVAAWGRATVSAAASGFIVPEDAKHLVVVGAQSDILK